jgi:hypothetical protein
MIGNMNKLDLIISKVIQENEIQISIKKSNVHI